MFFLKKVMWFLFVVCVLDSMLRNVVLFVLLGLIMLIVLFWFIVKLILFSIWSVLKCLVMFFVFRSMGFVVFVIILFCFLSVIWL